MYNLGKYLNTGNKYCSQCLFVIGWFCYCSVKMQWADVAVEYKKNRDLKKEDVDFLMGWVEKQPHLPTVLELQIILFLHSSNYSIEQAKEKLNNYFTLRTLCPEIFKHRTPEVSTIYEAQDIALVTVLPKRTPDGYTVLYTKLLNNDTSKYIFGNQLRLFDMTITRHLISHGTSNGFVVVFDLEGFLFGHLARMNVVLMKKFLYYYQNALPIKIIGLHYINAVPFVDKLLSLTKPFLKKEYVNLVYVHSKNMDNLYKVVPKDILPKDNGAIMALKEAEIKAVCDFEPFHRMEDNQLINKELLADKPKFGDCFGLDGTFKKLDID